MNLVNHKCSYIVIAAWRLSNNYGQAIGFIACITFQLLNSSTACIVHAASYIQVFDFWVFIAFLSL